ncbi:hypothetical protein [uncultured Ruminococcus sp.]|uniref:hypothetical protein n=1 Tax=uncultured Ruminococcus sp. TaxID=165186 RepID=UPI0025CEDF1A|nr:hypothetical protein [uncultured Ruminococcus sp.]
MMIFDTVKGTVSTAVDTISTVAQSIVEKNRTNAKLNRLRLVMKSESELMNRAYIALGKQFYESQKKGEAVSVENQEKLFEVIEKSKAKIARARECYRKIVDSQNDIFYGTPEEEKDYSSNEVVDITVACSNESDYKSSPFENIEAQVKTAVDEIKYEAEEVAEKVEDKAEEIAEKAEEKAEEIKEEITSADEEADSDGESPEGELF